MTSEKDFELVPSRNDPGGRRAAVLICLLEGQEGELRVILTKRSMKLSSYPGDVALPGEKNDVDDMATALREAMEEIGLNPDQVEVAATLEPFYSQVLLNAQRTFVTLSIRYIVLLGNGTQWPIGHALQHLVRVVPVVGLLRSPERFVPALNSDEVDAIFEVPLEMFLKDEKHRYEEKEWKGWTYVLHVIDFQANGDTFHITGLTARVMIRVASVVYQRSPAFNMQVPDFQHLQELLKLVDLN